MFHSLSASSPSLLRNMRRTLLFVSLLLSGCASEGETQTNRETQAQKNTDSLTSDQTPVLTLAMLEATPASLGANYEIRDGRVVVSEVLPGSPADQGGMQPGDVVLKIENSTIEKIAHIQEKVEEYAFDNRALVEVERNGTGKLLRVPLTVDLSPAPERALPAEIPLGKYSCLNIYYDNMSKRTESDPMGTLTLSSGGKYRWFEGAPGKFRYDSVSGDIQFEDGVWGDENLEASLGWTDDQSEILLRIVFTINENNDLTYSCNPRD